MINQGNASIAMETFEVNAYSFIYVCYVIGKTERSNCIGWVCIEKVKDLIA